jgi:hypothetical protein
MQAGWRGAVHKSADQSGYADFVFPIGGNSKPGTFKIVAEIHGSNISEAQSFEVIPVQQVVVEVQQAAQLAVGNTILQAVNE